MILDSFDNLARYAALHARFRAVADYFRGLDLRTLPAGRHTVDGDDIFFIVTVDGPLRAPSEALLEAHDRYIDIQIVLRGEETFGWSPRAECMAPRGAIDPDKDILFFDDTPATRFTLRPGQMAIFMPDDAHAPMIGTGAVTKIVVKVRL